MSFEPIEVPVEGLIGDGIRLRLAADADRPRLDEARRDPAIQRFAPASAGADGEHVIVLVIADLESDEPLGTVEIRRRPHDPARWSIGYWVAPWSRRRGVASEAVRVISRYAFEALGAQRIELTVEPSNAASNGVADRVGFVSEGVLRRYLVVRGARRDAVMYSLLPDDLR